MIGQKIKKIRESKGMSISELAEKAGVAKSYLSSIERDIQSNPSIQFIEKIGRVLGVSVNELLRKESNEPLQHLDEEWLAIVKEAMHSGVSKEEFREYVAYNQWKNNQEDE